MVVGIVTRETVRPMSPSCRRLTSNRAPTVRSWGIHPRTGWQRRHPRFNARWLERGGRTHRRNASGRQIDRRSSVLHKTIALALDHQGGDAYRDNDYESSGEQRRNQPRLSFLTRTLLAMQHAWSPRLTLRRRRVGPHRVGAGTGCAERVAFGSDTSRGGCRARWAARPNAPALRYRSSGSLAMARAMTSSNAQGTAELTTLGRGGGFDT